MIAKKLGSYEIQNLIGAGGMGEVYRARDTRLDRTVAVKVLPAHLSNEPEVSPPEPLFVTSTAIGSNVRRDWRQQYDVTADGKRFLFLTSAQSQAPWPVTVFSNWQSLAKR